MKPGRTAAWVITAIALPGLVACSGTSSGSSPASPGSSSAASTSSPTQSQAASTPTAQGQTAGSGSLTPPGAHYVQLRVTALGSTAPPKDSDPAITFNAIDDRGQQQQSVTFLGTFSRCDDPFPPKQFVSGKTYQSCLTYLIPGGGSIQKVQWDNGPSAANQVTPYFDRPIVWG